MTTKKFYTAALLTMASAMAASAAVGTRTTAVADNGAEPRLFSLPVATRAKAPAAPKAPQRVAGAAGSGINFVDKYGTLTLVLEEDFSNLDFGSEENPDLYSILEIDPESSYFTYPWWNFITDYTKEPNWGVGNAFAAGGSLYFPMENSQSHVNTPCLDVSKSSVSVVEFRARARKGETYDYLQVEAAETNNMGPSWDNIDEPILITGIPDEWTTYRVLFRGGGPTSIFNFVGMAPGYMYIDDIKVYQLTPYLEYPTALPHTNYKGTSFTANWQTVEGAEKYLLSVYSLNDLGEKVYLVTDREVNGTSSDITGAESGKIYFYNVKAVKGEHTSLESFDMVVYDLETPVMNPVEITGEWSYRASWSAVPGADVYNYTALDKRVADADGLFVVTDEDFTDVADADGYRTGLTKEDPDTHTYDEHYIPELRQNGWKATHYCPYDDYIALDAYFYSMQGSDAALTSPEMDFSRDGGKFALTVDLAGEDCKSWDENDNPITITTQACVALFNFNETTGNYEQVELLYPDRAVTFDWHRYTFNFTKGSKRSIVGIFAISSLGNLYIDNLRITQNYSKGDALLEPFLYKRFHGKDEGVVATQIDVEIPRHASGYEVYHRVTAYGRIADQQAQVYVDRESAPTDLEFVRTTTSGIAQVTLSEGSANVEGSRLVVSNPGALEVTVADSKGALLLATTDTEASLELGAKGIYIVRIGSRVIKCAY